jgi:hypothetical protein
MIRFLLTITLAAFSSTSVLAQNPTVGKTTTWKGYALPAGGGEIEPNKITLEQTPVQNADTKYYLDDGEVKIQSKEVIAKKGEKQVKVIFDYPGLKKYGRVYVMEYKQREMSERVRYIAGEFYVAIQDGKKLEPVEYLGRFTVREQKNDDKK